MTETPAKAHQGMIAGTTGDRRSRSTASRERARHSMRIALITADDRDACSEDIAAELTRAVYRVALRRGLGVRWLDLQLDLWKVLTQAIRTIRLAREEATMREAIRVVPVDVGGRSEGWVDQYPTTPISVSQERPFPRP